MCWANKSVNLNSRQSLGQYTPNCDCSSEKRTVGKPIAIIVKA
jgi:hypothetical protein